MNHLPPIRPPGSPPVAFRLARIALLVTGLAACGGGDLVSPGERHQEAFDRMWEAFDLHYPLFAVKGVDWNQVRATFEGPARSATSTDAFIEVVKNAVATLHDRHAWLTGPGGQVIATATSDAFVNWNQTVWWGYVHRGGWSQVKPNLGFAELNGVAYISIGAWNTSQFSADDVDQILERFRDRDRLIVDVRANSGGSDLLSRDVAARFTPVSVTGEYVQVRDGTAHGDLAPETPRTVQPRGTWQFTGQVHLLAGRRAASANETFIAFMRELPHVTVVGDTTSGASGNHPMPVDLTSGWTVQVPRWLVRTADRTIVEGSGIAPDVVIPVTAADFAAGRDPVLDYSMAVLAGAPRRSR